MSDLSASERELIDKLNEFIQNNLDNEHYGVSELADDLGMGRSNLLKKVKAITKITASQYIRQFRLKRAMEILQQTSLTVSEVSYKTGFNSPSYFIKCFHEFFGYSPGEVKNRNENEERAPIRSNKKQFSILFSTVFFLVVIIVVLIIVVKPFSNHQEKLEKTIAVLPFIDNSPQKGNTYIINGLMEEILDKLQNIGDLKVKSRTDTEKYRDTKKNIREIARELDVNYIIEGSGQVIGDQIKLSVQLIETLSGNHIWSKTLTEGTEDIFRLQEDVARMVASELKANLTPGEQIQIKKLPTENIRAYNLFLKGLEHERIGVFYAKASDKSIYRAELRKAKELFEQAIELDSTFVEPYVQLASEYINNFYYDEPSPKLRETILDSGLNFVNSALKYDPENGDAILFKIDYYRKLGMENEVTLYEKKFFQTGKFKNWEDYLYFENQSDKFYWELDYFNAIKYYYKYLRHKPETIETKFGLINRFCWLLKVTGFPEQSKSIAKEILVREEYDSISYWITLGKLAFFYESDRDLEYFYKAYKKDTLNYYSIHNLMRIYIWTDNYTQAYRFMKKLFEAAEKTDKAIESDWFYGYVYLKNGFKDEADKQFKAAQKKYLEQIELNLPEAQIYLSHFELASMFSILGEKEKALVYLKSLMNLKTIQYDWLYWLQKSPVFNAIRDEPIYQEVQANLEAKYEKEHERIGKLLRDLGKL